MLPKYVLTIMELNWNQGYIDKKTKFNIRRQVQKRNIPVQSAENYCFSLLNMQICDILAVVVVVFASPSYCFSLYCSLPWGPCLLCIITICCQYYLRNRFIAEIESRNVFE